jgi:hypothetical protein
MVTGKDVFRTMLLTMILKLKNEEITTTKQGSVDYLLYGPRPSVQSVNIKIGNRLEILLNEFSEKMGMQTHKLNNRLINGHQLDSLFVTDDYLNYDEQKTNVNLDSEKLKETIKKILEVRDGLIKETGKDVNYSIFHTTVWEKTDAPNYSNVYSKFIKSGIKVKFMSDYFKSLNVDITKEEFYLIWKEAGEILSKA